MTPDDKERKLLAVIRRHRSVVVAFSGGVDSSYLAFMAHKALGRRSRAVTALSPSVSQQQRDLASEFVRQHGLSHAFIETREMDDPGYRANPSNRCYFCKNELYQRLAGLARDWKAKAVLDGANADDLSDYRPGRRAADQHGVLSPLAEVGLGKEEIRSLSRKWGLESWDQPAMPCLASRIPYGTAVSDDALRKVEKAESYLRRLGLREFRVRHHGNLARIEVDRREMARLLEMAVLDGIHKSLTDLGYLYVALDLKGFRSGSLNEVLQLEAADSPR